MNESMRKINFYENILEFKEKRKEKLTINEVNNWEICRTCLADTNTNDVDVEKMCVMDATQGTFFNIKEMLAVIANIKISSEDKIALRVCTTCFNKITTLYYFTLQVRKAENILKRMTNKINDDNTSFSTCIKEDIDQIKDKEHQAENTDESIIIEVEELFGYTPDMENAMEIDANIIEDNDNDTIEEYDDEVDQQRFKEEGEESKEDGEKDSFECFEELFQEVYEEVDSEPNNNTEIINYENMNDKQQPENDYAIDTPQKNEENQDTLSYADSFEELYITDTEFLEEASSQIKDNGSSLDNSEKPIIFKPQRIKRIQPRCEVPLLEDFKCRICVQEFQRQNELIIHVQEEHPNTQAFKCRFCSSAFAHIQSLSRHVRKHKAFLIKYTCQYCYREFLRPDDLKRHVRTHTGERPYQCSYCEKAFKQQGEMKSHEETHLPKKTYYCPQCPKTLSSRNGLYLHKRIHHNKNSNLFGGKKKRVTKKEKQKESGRVLQLSSDEGE